MLSSCKSGHHYKMNPFLCMLTFHAGVGWSKVGTKFTLRIPAGWVHAGEDLKTIQLGK